MGNGRKKDELLELAQQALKQARPKRRRIGVVEGDGSVTPIVEEAGAEAKPTRKAAVLPMRRKPKEV